MRGTEKFKAQPTSSALRETPQSAAAPLRDYRTAALAALLVLLVVTAFYPCLENGFVSWDDDKNFLENLSYRGLGWSQIRWAWTSFQVGVYQPLAWIILEVQYVLFGLNPWGYHLTSLILYAIDTVVLFRLTLSLLARCRSGPEHEEAGALLLAAALAVALFAVHPLRTEVVAWVSCQPYLPCALFSMLAVLAYLQAFRDGSAPQWTWLVGALFLFTAALLSKAVAVSLPAVLVILDVYPLRRLGGGPGRWFGPAVRKVWWEKVPFGMMSAIFMVLAIVARAQEHLVSAHVSSTAARIAQACYGIWFNMVKTVLPWNLTAYYPVPERVVWSEPPFVWGVLGTFGVSVGLFLLRRRWPGLLAVWLSYLVILVPNLGLVRPGIQLAADRYSYIAMMGGVVLAAAGLGRFLHAAERVRPAAVGLIAGSLGVLFSLVILTWSQCRTWRTSENLWTHVLNHGTGRNCIAHYNLGVVLSGQGRVAEAAVRYIEALRINPNYADAHNNLGLILYGQGRVAEATAQYTEALRINPNYAEAHNNLGLILAGKGRTEEARAQFTEALRINPHHPEAHNNLGLILLGEGRFEEASARFAEAMRLNPDYPEAHTSLGALLLRQGRTDEAVVEFTKALRLKPDLADAHYNLGVVSVGQRRTEEARARFAEAMRLNPNHANAHYHLGVILSRQGRTEQAVAQFTEALRLNPNYADAHYNLGVVLSRQGRIDDAMAQFAEALRLNPNYAAVQNHRAMIWATYPEAKHRDGQRAVDAATQACTLTGWKHAGFLDTLAAASAEAGDFDKAVQWQVRAIDLLTDETTKKNFRSRLKLYQAGQPYREAIELH